MLHRRKLAEGAEKLRVLVVEDEAMVAMLIEDMLIDCGCGAVSVAGRMDQARQKLDSDTYDFAILDLNLSGEWTYPLADKLLEKGTPFVFATGYGSTLLEGVYASVPTLQKPFQLEDVERVLRVVRGGAGLEAPPN